MITAKNDQRIIVVHVRDSHALAFESGKKTEFVLSKTSLFMVALESCQRHLGEQG